MNKFYHYTNLGAFDSILQKNAPQNQELCFWATRFDCFEDKEEFKYGISLIHDKLIAMEETANIDNQIRIGQEFIADNIIKSDVLPKPFIISLCKNYKSEKMWKEYADNKKGVVLGLELTEKTINTILSTQMQGEIKFLDCLYDNSENQDLIKSTIISTYNDCGRMIWDKGIKEPIIHLQMLIYAMLLFCAPRIKRNEFKYEEESRLVWSIPDISWLSAIDNELKNNNMAIEDYVNFLNAKFPSIGMPLSDIELKRHILKNKERMRGNNKVFYREIYMPKCALSTVYVRTESAYKKVDERLKENNINAKIEII